MCILNIIYVPIRTCLSTTCPMMYSTCDHLSQLKCINKTVFSSWKRYLYSSNALMEIKQSCVVRIFPKRWIKLTLVVTHNPRYVTHNGLTRLTYLTQTIIISYDMKQLIGLHSSLQIAFLSSFIIACRDAWCELIYDL